MRGGPLRLTHRAALNWRTGPHAIARRRVTRGERGMGCDCDKNNGFIGVFDSGVGGISVLKSLVAELPGEDFHYFGDSANAPYGEKTEQQVCELSSAIVDRFVADGAKAIVIACNTATSAAGPSLRAAYSDLPIIGIEPALKPATEAPDHGRILVMATDITLSLDKYHELAETYGKGCEVISVPCPGLAGRIEHGDLEASDLVEMIRGYVGSFAGTVGSVVLGCTHYPFVRRQITEVLGDDVKFYDGGAGTARQLRKRLTDRGLLAPEGHAGAVEFASSKDTAAELELYREFFGYEL